jgi:hypothetical protein
MSRGRTRLSSEMHHLKAIHDEMPESEWLGRLAITSRITALQHELASAPEQDDEHVALTFRGTPVHGSESIRASFASGALKRFQSVFGAIAKQARSALVNASEAPIPELLLVGTARGSFGFEFQESFTSETGSVLREASRLMDAAKDDDLFASALQDSNPDVIKTFASFMRAMKAGGAGFRITGHGWGSGIDQEAMDDALRRVGTAEDHETSTFEGMLTGLLPDDRKFELTLAGGRGILKGTIPAAAFRDYEGEFIAGLRRKGTATVLVRSFEQPWSDVPRKTHTLLRFIPSTDSRQP